MNYSFAAGCFFLLSFVVYINPQHNSKSAKTWFSSFLICVGLALIEQELYEKYPNFVTLSECSRFLIAPCLYFSIVYFTHPKYNFSKYDLLHFIPFSIFTFFAFSFLIHNKYPITLPPQLIKYLGAAVFLTLRLQIIVYWTMSFVLLRRHRKNITLFSSEDTSINLNWLLRLLFGILAIILIGMLRSKITLLLAFDYLPIFYSFACGAIAFYIVIQKEIYPFPDIVKTEIQEIIESNHSKKSPVPRLNAQEAALLKLKLEFIMESEKPYLQSDLNLYQLAEKLSISTHDLSFLLNSSLSISFNSFINNYRINEAKNLLKSNKHTFLSIEGIGYESGFSSKSAFFTCFKKIVGCSPLEFKKNSDIT
jgi:AraC-like DNA-binding protein